MTLICTVQPTEKPVTLELVKLQTRIDDATSDALLELYISAAREEVEKRTPEVLITSTWQQTFDAFPIGGIRLGKRQVTSIASIRYVDAAGALQTLPQSAYTLDVVNGVGCAWPTGAWPAVAAQSDAVRITFVAGYGDTSAAVPAALRQWILLAVAYMDENKTESIPDDYGSGLLWSYREYAI